MADETPAPARREFLRGLARWGIGGALIAGVGGLALRKPARDTVCADAGSCRTCPLDCPGKQPLKTRNLHVEAPTVWQIDPHKCTQCGRCATECVLTPSAVKCVHAYELCGYCDLCTGFFEAQPNALNTGAENQLCPTNALMRKFIEDPYYEYMVDEKLCIGCAKCVKGCTAFGNGSLFLQIRHDRCVNCNECSIARVCPAQAIARIPVEIGPPDQRLKQLYRLKNRPGRA